MKIIKKELLIVLVLSFFISISNYSSADNVSENSSRFVKVEGEYALKEDGSVWKYELFDHGKNKKIAEDFIDIDCDMSGLAYTGIKSDGTLWVWGENNSGQFAGLKLESSEVPVKIMDNVKAIAGTVALKNDGTVWVWGGSKFIEAKNKENNPQMIYKGAKAISYDENYIFVIDDKEVLYGLPNYTGTNKGSKKIKISQDVIFVNKRHYIKKDKTLWENTFRSDNSLSFKLILKDVNYADSDLLSNCAIKTDGSLWVWGLDDDNIPASMKGLLFNPQKIAEGVKYGDCEYQSIIAIKSDGSMFGFGAVCPEINYTIPKGIIKNVEKVFDNDWVLTKDGILWRVQYYIDKVKKIKIAQDVKDVTEEQIIVKNDGSKWCYLGLYYGSDCELMKLPEEIVTSKSGYYMDDKGSIFGEKLMENGMKQLVKLDKVVGVKEFDAGNHLMFYKKNDNSLWISLIEKNDLFSPKVLERLAEPVKIMEDIKEFKICDNYVYAISHSGKLYVCRINLFESDLLETIEIMDGVDAFDNRETFPMGLIMKDKSHMSGLGMDEFVYLGEAKKDFAKVIYKNLVKDIENMEDILTYNKSLYIKKNGELWVKVYFINEYDLVVEKFVKVMDNVRYGEVNNGNGIAICKDGSLWELNIKYDELSYLPEGVKDYIETKKLLENVKEAHCDYYGKVFTAVQEDDSFYVWGDNSAGMIGIDTEDNRVLKPLKIMDDVKSSSIGFYQMSVLKKDGTLMHWGTGFPIGHNAVYVANPLNSGKFQDGQKILHRNYEAVGINEEFELIVKITDPLYTKDVKVVFWNGEEILMEKSSNGYYTATVPGNLETKEFTQYIPSEDKRMKTISKLYKYISYQIIASDSNGNTITSEEYRVGVISNDVALIDSMNDEVVQCGIKVYIDEKELISDSEPVIKSGRTMIPVRSLFESLNAEVLWDQKLKKVDIIYEGKRVSMKIGEKTIGVNNETKDTDVAPTIVNGRTMLPLRAVGEILGFRVNWNGVEKKVELYSH